jgi:hypothetical protein
MSHVLLWRSDDGPPSGAGGLLGWVKYSLESNPFHFFRCGEGQINKLATDAVQCAVARGCDVTIAWGATPDFRATPAHQLEETFRGLRPAVIALPERPGKTDRWAISSHGTPASVPAAGIQQALSDQVAILFPRWQHGIAWNCTAFLLRHDISAEELGLVEPPKPTADDMVNLVANDPDVLEANRRADPGVAGTLRDLVDIRLVAQTRAGVAPEELAPLCSGEVETYLIPIVARMVKGDAPGVVAWLRKDLRRLYGDRGEVVLQFMLRNYPHSGPAIRDLREAAGATAATAA